MDAQSAQTPCQGITKNKKPCTRNTNLDANGYCFQHADQVHHVGGVEPQPAAVPRSQPAETTTPSHPAAVPRSQPSSSSDHSDSSGSDSHPESHEESPLHALPQCMAISYSTRSRCRHLVSFAGETHCPSHGGRQKAPLAPVLPQCKAIAKNTRRQCTKPISVSGETFCPAHGGCTKGATKVAQTAPPLANSSRGPVTSEVGNASVPWHGISSAVLRYVIEDHPVQCGCDPSRRCNTMQTIRLILSLANGIEDNATSEEGAARATQPPHDATHWATLLSSQGRLTPQAVWMLGLHQVVASSMAARATTSHPTSPPPVSPSRPSSAPSFRLPSDLDSFLQEFVPRASGSPGNPQSPLNSPPAPF